MLELALLGLTAWQGIEGAADTRKQGRLMYKASKQNIGFLEDELDWFKDTISEQKGLARDIFGNNLSSLVEKTGLNKEMSLMEYNKNISQSDLAYSGTLAQKKYLSDKDINLGYKSSAQTLTDRLNRTLMGYDISLEQKEMDINKQIAMERANMKAAKQMQKTKFLGIF